MRSRVTTGMLRRACFVLAAVLALWVVVREVRFYADFPAPTRAVLEGGATMTVLSLNPDGRGENVCKQKPDACFHEYPILGQITRPGVEARQVYSAWQPVPVPAMCFLPRHGVRVTHNGHTVDMLLCFHCSSAKQWYDGTQTGYFPLRSRHDYWNDVLAAQGVPIAP